MTPCPHCRELLVCENCGFEVAARSEDTTCPICRYAQDHLSRSSVGVARSEDAGLDVERLAGALRAAVTDPGYAIENADYDARVIAREYAALARS